MSAFLSNLIFLNPWILAGLGALPLLWFLLRITPPAPRLVTLPTMRFLEGLVPETQTPSHTPWWILLLRIFLAALVLLALAHPVYNPAGQLPGSGPVRLVIDNGWASGQTWSNQIKAAQETLSQAERENRDIYILTTAPAPGNTRPASHGLITASQGASILKALEPLPWPADYKATLAFIKENKPERSVQSLWFSNGLEKEGFADIVRTLQAQGGLTYLAPEAEQLPLLLRLPKKSSPELQIAVDAPAAIPDNLPVSIQALATDGRVLDRQSVNLDPAELPSNVTFDIPEILRNEISQFRINTRNSVGSIFVLDERFRKRAVGIVSPLEDAETKPFIEASYYLKRALEPYTSLHIGDFETVLEQEPSVIILPDIGAMPAQTLNALENWVREGGLLLRFAGPNMAQGQGETFLAPVPLRLGGRSLEGSLAWEDPARLKDFPENSPFYGLSIHEDITVRQQILAEPVEDLDEKTWARLDDGTPLITAAPLENGLLVMVHTSATPAWSDLALSGSYVEILRRIVAISGRSQSNASEGSGFLQPLWVFDGFGSVRNPDSTVQSIAASVFKDTGPSSTTPPGLYGRAGFHQALNIGEHAERLKTPESLPVSVTQKTYGAEYERDLLPIVLYMALILLLIDWMVMIFMALGIAPVRRMACIGMIISLGFSVPAHASEETDLKYTEGLYLAYIQTGDASVDAMSYKGLENLSAVLKRRTSVEPVGIAALNPEYDTLVFFPVIYWPVSAAQSSLSAKALQNIQHYLDHGGTILFDTREPNPSTRLLARTKNGEHLQRMISSLNIPPLEPVPDGHVLSRSFYLLESYPGRYTGNTLWVETKSVSGRDDVSSVIIGSHDWAAAWAAGRSQRSSFGGGSRQQELAYRFGVNLIMYALTGNYKADQVHVPHILERLGQ